MSKREDEIETEPNRLDEGPQVPKTQASIRTFAVTMADFFRRNDDTGVKDAMVVKARQVRQASLAAQSKPPEAKSMLSKHWESIRADGITASEFIAFLQPLADLDGIAVSYIYNDGDGTEHVYKHRRGELGSENPLSRAIQERKLPKEKALSFALNEEGRIWIESNFIELDALK